MSSTEKNIWGKYEQDDLLFIEKNYIFFDRHTEGVKNDDYVVLVSDRNDTVHIGRISGEYFTNEETDSEKQYKSVKWLRDIPRKYFSNPINSEIDQLRNVSQQQMNKSILEYLNPSHTFVGEKHMDWEKARISQLISYMADCQQGMRDINGQILTVLTVVSTLLSLLFGISIFRIGDAEVVDSLVHLPPYEGPFEGRLFSLLNILITRRRLYFWLTAIVFAATVLYVVFLGIESILRYHYSQHLADRLHTMIPGTADDIDRNALLTFEQFAGPIRTLNYKHLSTSHSMFNFFSAYMATILAGVFCLIMVVTQYILLDVREPYDHVVLFAVIFILAISLILFVRFYALADTVADRAFEMGNENLEVRKGIAKEGIKLYRRAEEFREFFHYLILPRRESIFKSLLLVAGFSAASFISGDVFPTHLVYIIVVFEFLLYQARYQFNDIRNLKEGKTDNKQKKLADFVAEDKPFRITITIIMVLVRSNIALLMIGLWGASITIHLFVTVLCLIVVSVAYEFVRTKEMGGFTILLCGTGFPLRFYVGALAASKDSIKNSLWPDFLIIMSVCLLWGMSVTIMKWVREVDNLSIEGKNSDDKKHKKAHYNIVYQWIKARRSELGNEKRSVLSVKGRISDIWFICYCFLLILLFVYRIIYMRSILSLFLPLLSLVSAFVIYVIGREYVFYPISSCVFFTYLDAGISWVVNYRYKETIILDVLLMLIIVTIVYMKRISSEPYTIPPIIKNIPRYIFGKEAFEELEKSNNMIHSERLQSFRITDQSASGEEVPS